MSIINSDLLVYRMAEAIRTELATMSTAVCEMAKDDGPHDMTPFNLLAVAALKVMQNVTPEASDLMEHIMETEGYVKHTRPCDIAYQQMIKNELKDFI